MNLSMFSPPKRVKISDMVAVAFLPVVLLLLPDREFEKMTGGWMLGLFVALPFSFIGGLLSSWMYYGKHDVTCIDPFYIRAWFGSLSAAIALPLCLLFQPNAASFAFCGFTFGLGSVIAFHVYHRVRRYRNSS